MSFLRLAHPNQPTRIVDLGPGHARVAGFGGRMVTPVGVKRVPGQYADIPTAAGLANKQRSAAAKAEKAAAAKARCGALLKVVGEPCARANGHKDSHRSQFALDSAAQQRRTGLEL